MITPDTFVSLFRASSPYIHAHRGRTLVLMLGGDSLAHDNLTGMVHDIALLSSMGIRLVLVHGARPQIDAALARAGQPADVHNGLRRTSAENMPLVRDAVAGLRAHLEGLFTTGLPGSPMANTRIRVVGGNFVTARPMGVVDGVDLGFTGAVRRVHVHAIREQLDLGNIVLLPCLGASLSGEVFNLYGEHLAVAVATALRADKLVLFGPDNGIMVQGKLQSSITPAELARLDLPANSPERLRCDALARAVSNGVGRAHLLSFNSDGALLRELFTREGCGTQVTRVHEQVLRDATAADIGGIIELIRPLEDSGLLVRRSRELLEQELDNFVVAELEGLVIGCAALYSYPGAVGELACLAVHPDFRDHHLRNAAAGPGETPSLGELLLDAVEAAAVQQQLQRLFVLTTQTEHWFLEHGFAPGHPSELPPGKTYNMQRNSKVLAKTLHN